MQKGAAQITGRVTLIGTPPPMKTQLVSCNPNPDAPKTAHTDRTVLVSQDGGLADTYVFVTSPALKGSGAKEPARLLDQTDCSFSPHALGLQIGQSLRIRNSDPTFHNVHWDSKFSRPVNVGFSPSPGAPEKIVAINAAEFLSVRCDVHPWMTSTIAVFDHPFFAVTNEAGEFTIKDLPPGDYTIATYHPYFGEGTPQQVSVPGSAAPSPLNFSYSTATSPKVNAAP